MPPDSPDAARPHAHELQDAFQTLAGLPSPEDTLLARLQFLDGITTDAGALPAQPLLAWRQSDRSVRHRLIKRELTVGRQMDPTALAISDDQLLSRRHFVIRAIGDDYVIEDLQSHNGTAINGTENRIQRRALRDGDLILAGNQVFVFLEFPGQGNC